MPVLSKYIIAPKFYANTSAASFPLGSINPYNKSYIVIHAYEYKSADVPLMLVAQLVILKYAFFRFIEYF